MEILRVSDFSYYYPECSAPALDGINLSVSGGEFITLCGLSGSGKSTLLSCLKGCGGRKSGEISVFGLPQSEFSDKWKIGFVTQSPDAQAATDKVWHELAFGAESIGMRPERIRSRIAQLSLFFGIEALLDKKTAELSGGQKQLINLASVMVTEPEILLLDEPTSQLDPIAAENFISLLVKINKELGTAIIAAEHNLNGFMPISSRVIMLDNGKITADEQPKVFPSVLAEKKHPLLLSMSAGIQLCAALNSSCADYPLNLSESAEIYRSYAAKNKLHTTPARNAFIGSETAVKLKEVSFKYGTAVDKVLDKLDMEIYKGEAFCIMGGNGAGKTTLLKLICGTEKPLYGSIAANGKMALLPQNPALLFSKETVLDELSASADSRCDIEAVIKLCKLENLLKRHPYDLSGGETQRAALAKLLTVNADILLLDEPTKGMDKQSCIELSDILSKIKGGKTIIIVSHDVDFCAENADRCALLFDGMTAVCEAPQAFFKGGIFFTTEAARISAGISDSVITTSELIFTCTGNIRKAQTKNENIPLYKDCDKSEKKQAVKKQITLYRKICTAAGITLTAAIMLLCSGLFPQVLPSEPAYLPYILLCLPVALLFIGIAPGNRMKSYTDNKKPLSVGEITTAALTAIIVPLTVIFGSIFLDGRKYLFISLLILAECFIPFMLLFERKRPSARQLALLSVMCAAAVASRELFFMLPQFKPVAAIVIISGIAFGAQSGFIVGAVSMLVSNLLFGQGVWTPWQMLAMGLIGFFAGLIFYRRRSVITVSIYGFLSVLILYGGIMNISQVLIYNDNPNPEMIISYILSGLPFDLIHAVATVIFLLLGGAPLFNKLRRAANAAGI